MTWVCRSFRPAVACWPSSDARLIAVVPAAVPLIGAIICTVAAKAQSQFANATEPADDRCLIGLAGHSLWQSGRRVNGHVKHREI